MIAPLLVVFAKAPRPGHVKTRLCPPLTPEEASAVHEASLKDVVEAARDIEVPMQIRHAGGGESAVWFGESFPGVPRAPQGEGHLGERMARTFAEEFRAGSPAVVLVGSDAPTLPAPVLKRACHVAADCDLVLGPAWDGGYYLIGLRASAWPAAHMLFEDVPWSTDRVLGVTLERLASVSFRVEILQDWYDIDRIDDLRRAADDATPESHLGRLIHRELAGHVGLSEARRS